MNKHNDGMNEKVHTLLTTFANQLTEILKETALMHVEVALGGMETGGKTKSTRKTTIRMGRRPGRTSAGGKRSSAQLEKMRERLLAYLKKKPGQRGEQIAKALNTDVGTMRLPMKKLVAEKKVQTKGQRRGMTYFAA